MIEIEKCLLSEESNTQISSLARLFFYFLDPSDLTAFQPDLDAMGMSGGFGQDILDDTLGEFSGTLILHQDDSNLQAGFDFGTIGSIHASVKFLFF
jgi:hypothetical protein